ncbi:MAG: hypothetical protein IPK10_20290 [Bacteroidetes bacterium]|nr:hypothetical protein [Bacteroidota bacterium]
MKWSILQNNGENKFSSISNAMELPYSYNHLVRNYLFSHFDFLWDTVLTKNIKYFN